MDAERATYLKSVEGAFLALRGRGFMLSPRDVGLVDGWRTSGVPHRVVVGALDEAAKRFRARRPPGVPLPSSLAYFQSQIEEAIALWRERTLAWEHPGEAAPAGGSEPVAVDLRQRALAAVEAAGKGAESEGVREALRKAWRALARPDGETEIWSLTAEVDRQMVDDAWAALDGASREALDAEVEAVVSAPGGPMSEAARDELRQRERARRVRAVAGLPDLVEVLCDVEL
ncbi:MAG: hypothetical protein H6744_12975 [Deltaproteobacteria bacterium]|nr:hypothetical protein [Deltaproteobacteria bacterium]